jgi:hypothetical protein
MVDAPQKPNGTLTAPERAAGVGSPLARFAGEEQIEGQKE